MMANMSAITATKRKFSENKNKKIKIFEKNCWEVVWPPLALCRGGGVGAAAWACSGPRVLTSATDVGPCNGPHFAAAKRL